MSRSEDHRNLPPKMKRFALTTLGLYIGAMTTTTALRPWLGFWPTVIPLALIMIAILIPLGRAAKQEQKDLEVPDNSHPPLP
jgi:antibiotic biosynthesis monooxygenase (ABM) superfamily enzyme